MKVLKLVLALCLMLIATSFSYAAESTDNIASQEKTKVTQAAESKAKTLLEKSANSRLDLNQATTEQLKIKGLIGKKRAEKLVAYRTKLGKIESFEQLRAASELKFGDKIIAALQHRFEIK